MGKVTMGFTMSLDGFINDQNGSVERLYPDLDTLRMQSLFKSRSRRPARWSWGERPLPWVNIRSRYSWKDKRFEQGLAGGFAGFFGVSVCRIGKVDIGSPTMAYFSGFTEQHVEEFCPELPAPIQSWS